MKLTAMDFIRATLSNAQQEGLSLQDIIAMAQHAKTAKDLDTAINTLVRATNG